MTLDVIGADSGNLSSRPQDVLGQYDIVFAKARSALEALAVGNAVVLCDRVGCGPMVTTGDMERLRRLNFGVRAIQEPVTAEILEREIARYDAQDAAQVSRSIRASADREPAIEQIVELYYDVVREFESTNRDLDGEARAEARYLQQLSRHYESERDSILNSRTFRWRKQILNSRFVGGLLRSFAKR
nr:C675 [uncultured bacterium]